ncbi:MAG: hypothetical protein E3J72_21140 [Planctomycetota bacterium]|nr:MAG: hypothetical protein E3J72_21140 [Planctomycetota bacterium]
MSNWFTNFFSWLFGAEDGGKGDEKDQNWRDAFAKYDPTFKGKIKEMYDGAGSADAFFTGLEDLQIELEMKITERENEKGDIDKDIFTFQEQVAGGKVDKTEEAKVLRRADRSLRQAGKLQREIREIDTQYGMLMDFVTWLDEIVRKPEAAVEVNAVLWEKLRNGVTQRRASFESSRAAWREVQKQVETGQADDMAQMRERLLAYGKEPAPAEKTEEAPEKEDEALVKEKLLSYGDKKEEEKPAPEEKEPEKEAEPETPAPKKDEQAEAE